MNVQVWHANIAVPTAVERQIETAPNRCNADRAISAQPRPLTPVLVFEFGTNVLAQGLQHRNQSRTPQMVNGTDFTFREESPAISADGRPTRS